MNHDQTNQFAIINTTAIIFGMVLLFITLQIGFHPFYIKYFPKFEKFKERPFLPIKESIR
jgi:hypothetical protein